MSLYKETLMKHFRNPEYKRDIPDSDFRKDGVNPSCGDSITLYAKCDCNKVKDLTYTGNGCAISMASADILCSVIKDAEAPMELIDDFINFINGEDITFNDKFTVLEVFKEMQQYPARKSCALLPWKTIKALLTEN